MLNVSSYKEISLAEMEEVKLMNRLDRKFCINRSDLQSIIDSVNANYYLLNINDEGLMKYSTVYFDTQANEMFHDHHNGKLNRYKIRKRQYDITGISFLEVKFKNNKGRTIKKRMLTDFSRGTFTEGEISFLNSYTPYNAYDLKVSLMNNFTRITLVNKNFQERVTIDLNINFKYGNKNYQLDDLVVTEIKVDQNSINSPFLKTLLDHRHKSSGFSKYAIGSSIMKREIKRNAFKEKIRRLEKLLQTNLNLF
jgi:hypothetical protein